MSITDELREYVIDADGMGMTHGHAKSICAIADRIDAEHEADVSTACRLAAGLDNDALAKRGYIKLPVDADGVPIHVGDMMWQKDRITKRACKAIMGDAYVMLDGIQGAVYAKGLTHYHAPTVEDVLREFFSRYVTTKETKAEDDAILAEFAAKLRLAEEVNA